MAKIVQSTMISSNALRPGAKSMSKLVEQAMIEAVQKCNKEGISDPLEVRKVILAARDRVRNGFIPN